MLSESFKYFFAVTGLDLGPIGLALLAHIYGKVAICKSCEKSRRRTSHFRPSPGKQRFRSGTVRALRRGMVAVPGWSPAEIKTSGWVGRPGFLVPRSPIKYPPRWQPEATPRSDTLICSALTWDCPTAHASQPGASD